jgi:RNA polymerase sigma-70 factor (ECF subfamily)
MDVARARTDPASGAHRTEFQERFATARPRLTAVLRAVVGRTDAEDLVQETYVRASERLDQLRDPDRFEAWLVRIALNEAMSLHRRRRSERHRLRRAPHDVGAPATDLGLRELVERLDPRERAIVVLHYGYGYRMNEIATLLGLSQINVRTLAHRARRRLRDELEEVAP